MTVIEPSLALQSAFTSILESDPNVQSLNAPLVFDRVDGVPNFPYITVGDDQTLSDAAECLEGSVQVFSNIHIWSRSVGHVDAKMLSGYVVKALNNNEAIDLTSDGYRLVSVRHQDTRHLEDPDGLTTHSIVSFHSLLDEV